MGVSEKLPTYTRETSGVRITLPKDHISAPYTRKNVSEPAVAIPAHNAVDNTAFVDVNSFGAKDAAKLESIVGKTTATKIWTELAYNGRFDSLAEGRTTGDARGADDAVQERLAANREAAEARGWTECALERAAGMGHLTVWGRPPGAVQRHLVPDWLPESR